jgi:hypothetical protein
LARRARTCPFAPPPAYEEIREQEPVSRVRLPDGGRAWVISRHIQQIRRIGADVAVVHSRGSVVLAGQDPVTAPPHLDTWVLARHDGVWAVEAFHSCPEQAG